MMDAKEQIEQLAADFEKSRKILIALGDKNQRYCRPASFF